MTTVGLAKYILYQESLQEIHIIWILYQESFLSQKKTKRVLTARKEQGMTDI